MTEPITRIDLGQLVKVVYPPTMVTRYYKGKDGKERAYRYQIEGVIPIGGVQKSQAFMFREQNTFVNKV